MFGTSNRKNFKDLSEQEILALAIATEEDDSRIYRVFAKTLRPDYPDSARVFDEMAIEEEGHRSRLTEEFRRRFGDVIPLIRREHVSGFYAQKPVWLIENLGIERIRDEARRMEHNSHSFYVQAAARSTDAGTRELLNQLASAESGHEDTYSVLTSTYLTPEALEEEQKTAHRQFVLTWIQPGLAGLMDGSVSTLAPVFAAAFATHNTHETFLVGLAASVGAGISMGFTEAVSDDGAISGRGSPIKRGVACGIMTTLGGLGHAVPYLLPDFLTATIIAMIIVVIELFSIAWIQNRYMETPFFRAALQVVLGGALVFGAGILIGHG
ncbi:MAG: rubrerythrin family protein [Methylobacteriaceae bacterium]|jgi:rubrerythrin|nr:rubrerythrin family protein [Methylobacteriaceae bacterium]